MPAAEVPNDIRYMQRALELARRAEQGNEVPVGAVVVVDGSVAGEGWNQPKSSRCAPLRRKSIITGWKLQPCM